MRLRNAGSARCRDRLEQLERKRERERKLREQQKEQREQKERERRAEERRKEREARREGSAHHRTTREDYSDKVKASHWSRSPLRPPRERFELGDGRKPGEAGRGSLGPCACVFVVFTESGVLSASCHRTGTSGVDRVTRLSAEMVVAGFGRRHLMIASDLNAHHGVVLSGFNRMPLRSFCLWSFCLYVSRTEM